MVKEQEQSRCHVYDMHGRIMRSPVYPIRENWERSVRHRLYIHTAWASTTCSFYHRRQVRRPRIVGRVSKNSHALSFIFAFYPINISICREYG